jgi:hypothetical protein
MAMLSRRMTIFAAPLLLSAAPVTDWPPAALSARVVAAEADAMAPRREADLRAGCRQRDGEGHVTFVNGADGRPLLAALTQQPLADPRRDIWLSPHFLSARDRGRSTGTEDWAYVLDGDGDGRIDHIAYLIGPLPVRTGAPGEVPVPPIVDGSVKVTGADAMAAFFARLRFGFWQMIDMDGDGIPDAAAWPAERKVDGWHRGWALQRLGDSKGCWLVDAHGTPEQACALDQGGRDLVGEGAKAHLWARDAAAVFARIIAAAASCRFRPGSLRRAVPPS